MTHAPADPARGAVLALDIGGTKLAAGVVRADGTVLSFVTCPTESADGPEASARAPARLGPATRSTRPVWTPATRRRACSVGIGCGGPLDPVRGALLGPPHLPGWDDVPITRLVADAYGLPAVLENDGTAGAAGEWRFGAGRGTRHLLYLTVSTGDRRRVGRRRPHLPRRRGQRRRARPHHRALRRPAAAGLRPVRAAWRRTPRARPSPNSPGKPSPWARPRPCAARRYRRGRVPAGTRRRPAGPPHLGRDDRRLLGQRC